MHIIKRIFLTVPLVGCLIGLSHPGSAQDDKNKKQDEKKTQEKSSTKTKKAEDVVRDITPAEPPRVSSGTTPSNPTLQKPTKRTPKKKKEPPPPSSH